MRLFLIGVLILLLVPAVHATGFRGYYRYPALHGETVIFTANGDLYKVSIKGGVAQPFTTHPGEETHASLSPDGTMVAYSAQYEGPTDAYVMPVEGGVPTRLTYGEGAAVVGWTPDGKVLYNTYRYSTLPSAQLVEVDPKTRSHTIIPLAQASDGCIAPDGTVYFTRLPFQGSHTRRYQGGTAQNIWKLAPGAGEAVALTSDYAGTSKTPMYWKGRVYFVTDRDGFMNIWSMEPNGKGLRELTHHTGLDLQTPALDEGRIIYQFGADLYVYDVASNQDRLLDITLASDLDQTREKWIDKPMDYLSAAHISPKGDRVVLTARGQVFVAPAQQGRLVEATRKSGVRYRNARFAPDGKTLDVLSDESGEVEWWTLPANGVGMATQISNGSKVLNVDGVPSPDGKWIVYSNKDQELWLLDTTTHQAKKLAFNPDGEYGDFRWSPDSKWIAMVEPTFTFSRIALYGIDDGKITPVTTNREDNYSPAWSPDGKWLYFLSDRNLHSVVGAPWGPRQPEPFYEKTTRIYQIALAKGQRSPFEPYDELHPQPEDEKKPPAPAKPAEVKIDLDGIQQRLYDVPAPAGDYGSLSATGNRLIYVSRESRASPKQSLIVLDIQNHDIAAKALVDDIRGYELSEDLKHLLVSKAGTLYVIDSTASAPASLDKKNVDLSGWSFPMQPREEWRQMLVEAWRLERDYFYDRNMNGVDWSGTLKRVQPLVDRVTDREELNDLLGQMVSELSALHIFVVGGDIRQGQEHIAPAFLGAELSRDEAHGGYRIDRLYEGYADDPDARSPLANPDVDAKEGDVIQSINGVSTLSAPDPVSMLRNQAGKQVLVHLRSGATGQERDVIIKPLSAGQAGDLRYSDWEESRRQRVEQEGKGEIGYVHLRAMGSGDIDRWARDFYPVFDRQGLIVDVRHNGGGNIDSWILEKLMRKAWFYWQPRIGNPSWNMQWAFRGHAVVLCDANTASDGEAFTEGFRQLGLGKVIGTRTWGGEIWLSFDNRLVDNGIASAAETGVYGPKGDWLIEGHGVEPDIVIDNQPHETFEGKDAQLDFAIQYLQKEIREHPVPIPPAPKYPNKLFVPKAPRVKTEGVKG